MSDKDFLEISSKCETCNRLVEEFCQENPGKLLSRGESIIPRFRKLHRYHSKSKL